MLPSASSEQMGDVKISVKLLLEKQTSKATLQLAADSPLVEVINQIRSSLLSNFDYEFNPSFSNSTTSDGDCIPLKIYDVSLHPAKDITEKVCTYTSETGEKSITLQSMGWFPSAKVMIVNGNDEESLNAVLNSNINKDEDFQYNLPSMNDQEHALTGGVQIKLDGIEQKSLQLFPSQIFDAVSNRYQDDEEMADTKDSKHHATHFKLKQQTKISEENRRRKLDERIKKIDEKSKKSKVSEQVKKMLIKSRASGDKKIRVEDRFYLEAILFDDSNGQVVIEDRMDEPQYIFCGKTQTVSKIVSISTTGLNLNSDLSVELLIETVEGAYKRIPFTTHMYEAERKKCLSPFDRVVIRIHNANGERNYPSIFDEHERMDTEVSTPLAENESTRTTVISKAALVAGDQDLIDQIKISTAKAVQIYRQRNKMKDTKNISEKVNFLLMKGKSKGDKKLPITKRIYLEMISINAATMEGEVALIYASKDDQIFSTIMKHFTSTNEETQKPLIYHVKSLESTHQSLYPITQDEEHNPWISLIGAADISNKFHQIVIIRFE